MINAEQIIKEGLLKLEKTQGKPAQVGYDLSLNRINKVGGSIGQVLKDKTILNTHTEEPKIEFEGKIGWLLEPGVYDFILNEGCKIPLNRTAFMKQRSSMLRNGVLIQSSVWDPGFETDEMGTYGVVFEKIFIEENARIAQIYFHESTPVEPEHAYNGQYQKDKQR